MTRFNSTHLRILKALRTALQKRKAAGGKIICKSFGDRKMTFCAVSAHPKGVSTNSKDSVERVADALGVTREAMWAVVNGFDGYAHDPWGSARKMPVFCRVGKVLAEEFSPISV